MSLIPIDKIKTTDLASRRAGVTAVTTKDNSHFGMVSAQSAHSASFHKPQPAAADMDTSAQMHVQPNAAAEAGVSAAANATAPPSVADVTATAAAVACQAASAPHPPPAEATEAATVGLLPAVTSDAAPASDTVNVAAAEATTSGLADAAAAGCLTAVKHELATPAADCAAAVQAFHTAASAAAAHEAPEQQDEVDTESGEAEDDDGMQDGEGHESEDMAEGHQEGEAHADGDGGCDVGGDSHECMPPLHVCMVDGCDVDLSGMKPYFRRSKVCPAHQASAVVLLQGDECRFCQQCTRCHPVEEFDGTKRSCRSQLLHHNKSRKHRRRCTPGSFYSSKRPRGNGIKKKAAAAAAKKDPAAVAARAAAAAARAAAKAAAAAAAKENAAAAAAAAAAKAAAVAQSQPLLTGAGAIHDTDVWGALESANSTAAQPQAYSMAGSSRYGIPTIATTGGRSSKSVSKSAAIAMLLKQQQEEALLAGEPLMGLTGLSDGLGFPGSLSGLQPGTAALREALGFSSQLPGLPPSMAGLRDGFGFSGQLSGLQPGLAKHMSEPLPMSGAPSGLKSSSYMLQQQQYQQYQQQLAAEGSMLAASHSLGSYPNLAAMAPIGSGFNSSLSGIGEGLGTMACEGIGCEGVQGGMWGSSRAGGLPVNRTPSAPLPSSAGNALAARFLKMEEDFGPTSSCCSSRGSPNMAPAGGHISGGRAVITQPQQQQLAWQQQQQQLGWQQQQQLGQMNWQQQQAQQQQQQQIQMQANWMQEQQGSRRMAWQAQQQQQMQLASYSSAPAAAATTAAADLCADWQNIAAAQQRHQLQQPILQQQQQQEAQGMASMSSYGSCYETWSQQAAAAAAASNVPVTMPSGSAHATARAPAAYHVQRQQQNSATVAMSSGGAPEMARRVVLQQQQQHKALMMEYEMQQQQQQMLMQQQQSSPDMSAGSCSATRMQTKDGVSPAMMYNATATAGPAAAAANGGQVGATQFRTGSTTDQQQQHGVIRQAGEAPFPVMSINQSWGSQQGIAAPMQQQGFAPALQNQTPVSTPSSEGLAFDCQSSFDLQHAGSADKGLPVAVTAGQLLNRRAAAGQAQNPGEAVVNLPALAVLVGGLIDSDCEDGWLLDACQSPMMNSNHVKEACDALMDNLPDLNMF